MKKIILFIGLLLSWIIIYGQNNINEDQTLPLDTSIKKGVLPNGLTYYIHSTDVVKNAASYYIIQNVGSILEEDDQQGLAHFLEHMAFNGTKNFPGKGILNTLQKHGAVFGKDINAYTSFDETAYNLNNIPTKDGLVDTCLQVLHDWSNYLLLTEAEIDAERGVIKEEWRTSNDGNMRVMEKSLGLMFNDSKYAKRLPIGTMQIVENFKYKALRDFYHNWYRTDLQAIVIIGDVDIAEIEKQIKEKFSHIPAVKNPKKRFTVKIPDHKGLQYHIGMDKEVSTASISFGIRHAKPKNPNTVAEFKKSLLEGMATSLISQRLQEIAQKPEASFLGAWVGYGPLSRVHNQFSVEISPKPGKQEASFRAVMTEISRIIKFGFTTSEVKRKVIEYTTFYETQISKKNDRPHGNIIQSIQDNYLNNAIISDMEKEFVIAKQIFSQLTAADVHRVFKALYTEDNRTVNITGVAGKENLTEVLARKIIREVENNTSLEAYKEENAGKSLLSGVDITAGRIVSVEQHKEIDATTFTLSNGIKVHYKFVDKNKNEVSFNAISYGGNSLISDADLPSADLIGNILEMSGLGEFNAIALQKKLAGKTASVNASIDNITENLRGNATTKDVETMLQLTHLYFVKPRFDAESYQVLQSGMNSYLIGKSKNIKAQIEDNITTTLYGERHPRERIFNKKFISDISFDKMESIYNERFANPADFDYYIVGDIKKEVLRPLLEKYIASLPTNAIKENFKDVKTNWKSRKVDEDVYIAMEDPKVNVNIAFKRVLEYTLKNKYTTLALGAILDLRYTATLREQEGGVYSPRVGSSFSKEPKSQAYISVSFDCNPDLAEKLITIVHKEIEKVANGDIKEEDFDKTLTNFIKERGQAKDQNSYDMRLLTTFFRDGYNMNDRKNFESIVNSISKKDIQKLAKEIITKGQSYEIVIKPKK
jgi:zinc protease